MVQPAYASLADGVKWEEAGIALAFPLSVSCGISCRKQKGGAVWWLGLLLVLAFLFGIAEGFVVLLFLLVASLILSVLYGVGRLLFFFLIENEKEKERETARSKEITATSELTVKGEPTINVNITINSQPVVNAELTVSQNEAMVNNEPMLNVKLMVSREQTINSEATVNVEVTVNGQLVVSRKLAVNSEPMANAEVTVNGNPMAKASLKNGEVTINDKKMASQQPMINIQLMGGDLSISSGYFSYA